MTHTLEIPLVAQEAISKYKNLKLGSKSVQCPYFINAKRKKDLRALVGKGTPEEIVMEAKIWEKLTGQNFEKMSETEIKTFLTNKGLGIDCSGFVVHVLDSWYQSKHQKHIWSELKLVQGGLLSNIRYKLRPVENLGANTLTSEVNSIEIEINEVKPGDVIRSKWKKVGTHHIQLVTKVEYRENETVSQIEYTHATPYYGETSGVRVGQIKILDPQKPLFDQEWTEKDEHGVNFSFEGFMTQFEDNGLRRIKPMMDLI
jgi:hypothetical protein